MNLSRNDLSMKTQYSPRPTLNCKPSSFMTDLVWMVFGVMVLGSLLSAPHWLWVVAHWNDSTTPVPMGTVQRIHFVGDWAINTQIDTEEHSLLVLGVTRLVKGSRIEQRKTRQDLQLCAVDADRTVLHCEDQVRYP